MRAQKRNLVQFLSVLSVAACTVLRAGGYAETDFAQDPYSFQVDRELSRLKSRDPAVRANALENLSTLRDFNTPNAICPLLRDTDPVVRREAAMNLGWVGNRSCLQPLLEALRDHDWTVRQAAAYSLGNLTAHTQPFDSLAPVPAREEAIKAWETFVSGYDEQTLVRRLSSTTTTVSAMEDTLIEAEDAELRGPVLSNLYPGHSGAGFIDFRAPDKESVCWRVDVPEAGAFYFGFRYALAGGNRPLRLEVNGSVVKKKLDFNATGSFDRWGLQQVRVPLRKGVNTIRLTATGASGPNMDGMVFSRKPIKDVPLNKLRRRPHDTSDVIRAIGSMNVGAAAPAIIEMLDPYRRKGASARTEKIFVQACIRTLGRLGQGKDLLIALLDNPQWAVYAADALGEIGGEDAAAALLKAYPDYAKPVNGMTERRNNYHRFVRKVHSSDAPKLSCIDHIPRTSHMILHALARIPFKSAENMAALRAIVPQILSTMPSDFDATIVYTEEPYQMLAGYLIERAGMRRVVVDAAFCGLGVEERRVKETGPVIKEILQAANANAKSKKSTDPPFAGPILMSCCRDKKDIPLLIQLLTFEPNGWVRIHAAKTLLFMEATEAVPALTKRLREAKDDAEYGYDMDFRRFRSNNIGGKKLPGSGYDEYSDPSPRFKEAYLMALGGLGDKEVVPLLIQYLNNDRNVIEIQYAAAMALSRFATPEALKAMQAAEAGHPVESVRQVAREAIWRHGMMPVVEKGTAKRRTLQQLPVPKGMPREIVFLKGPHDAGNHEQISSDNTGYSTTDGGPTYRLGHNIYRFRTRDPHGTLKQITHFEDGFVADLEVSYDGERLLFCHRGPSENPWWHIYEMNADGSRLRQITRGPYHDVQPNYMPDGRIVFSTSRLGMRDEYHGYAATGLAVMNADGTDIHMVGFNLGRDAEPVIGEDGKILFSRLELFYSRMKTEWNLLSVLPDGTMPITHYGPERRHIWRQIRGAQALSPPRHRVLRITQPRPWSGSQYLINSFSGPMITGPGHMQERFLAKNNDYAITTPWKLSDREILVAAGKRPVGKDKKGNPRPNVNAAVDHGIHTMDVETGELTLIYNDPKTADFEARPLQPRIIPPLRPEGPLTRTRSFTGTLICESIYTTRHEDVKTRGRYVRITEGLPTVARHQTHMNGGIAWRNHGGAVGRHLGTTPVPADGSFAVQVPADRLFHCQVLDADRNVVGNELIWQYVRPGESKSCVGCHEKPDLTPVSAAPPSAHRRQAVKCLPAEDPLLHRAKMWFKGHAPDEREERMRTVNSVNLLGRL